MKKMFAVFTMVMALLAINFSTPAMALNPSACSNFGSFNMGSNVTCLGKLEMSDMGQFVNGVWQWYPGFASDWTANNYGPVPSLNDMIPTIDHSINITGGRLDNRRRTDGTTDTRIVLRGMTDGVRLPLIYKFSASDPHAIWVTPPECPNYPPGQCPPMLMGSDPGTWVGRPYATYPVVGYNTIYFWTPECQSPPGQGPPNSSCWQDADGNGVMDGYGGVIMQLSGGEALGMTNVASLSFNGHTTTPWYVEADYYRSMSWSTGTNALSNFGDYVDVDNLNFNPIPGLTPKGQYAAVLTLTDGTTKDINLNVLSDRIMPSVSAFTTESTYVEVKNNGKLKDITSTRTVVNVSAHEYQGQLIIQWVVPDLAFQSSLPGTSGIRLRVFVGDNWKSVVDEYGEATLTFLWIDVPVISGNTVVPAQHWEYIKNKMREIGKNYVEIAAQYREQYNGNFGTPIPTLDYHNRGYVDMVTYQFE